MLIYIQSNLKLIVIFLCGWKNLTIHECYCFDSFVFILFPRKMHIDVMWIKNGPVSLHCFICNDNPVFHNGITILFKNNRFFFFLIKNIFIWKIFLVSYGVRETYSFLYWCSFFAIAQVRCICIAFLTSDAGQHMWMPKDSSYILKKNN